MRFLKVFLLYFFFEIIHNFSEAIISWELLRVFPLMGFLEKGFLIVLGLPPDTKNLAFLVFEKKMFFFGRESRDSQNIPIFGRENRNISMRAESDKFLKNIYPSGFFYWEKVETYQSLAEKVETYQNLVATVETYQLLIKDNFWSICGMQKQRVKNFDTSSNVDRFCLFKTISPLNQSC